MSTTQFKPGDAVWFRVFGERKLGIVTSAATSAGYFHVGTPAGYSYMRAPEFLERYFESELHKEVYEALQSG
jgi:hypothetical protein